MNEKELNPEEATKIIQADREGRVKKCSEELRVVLEKYNCAIDISMLIRKEGIIPQVQLVPKQ